MPLTAQRTYCYYPINSPRITDNNSILYMRNNILTLLFLLIGVAAVAQNNPIAWDFEATQLDDEHYEIIITADIQDGWAVYDPEMDPNVGPVPTQFKILSENVLETGAWTIHGDRQEKYDELFEATIIQITGQTQFRQIVKLTGDVDKVEGMVRYMTCDSKQCLPPRNLSFEVELP